MTTYDDKLTLSKTQYALELWERIYTEFNLLDPTTAEQRTAVMKAINVTKQVLAVMRGEDTA